MLSEERPQYLLTFLSVDRVVFVICSSISFLLIILFVIFSNLIIRVVLRVLCLRGRN